MIYSHRFFSIDTQSRKVFDENNRELRLTGNAYRVLVYLCANRNASLTQLGEYLDHAKEYDENHLRQYRYKINTIVGKNVIEYTNGIYSLVGDVSESQERPQYARNTLLLQPELVSSDHEASNSSEKQMNLSLKPAVVAAVMLLLTFFDWPYAYFTLLRIVISAIAAYYAYTVYKQSSHRGFWLWTFIGIAVLFNPIVPIYLYDKTVWGFIDIAVAILMIIAVKKLSRQQIITD